MSHSDVFCLSFPTYTNITNENSQISSQISPNKKDNSIEPAWITWVKIDLENTEENNEEKLCPNLLQRAFCSNKSCKKVFFSIFIKNYNLYFIRVTAF